MRHLTGLDNQIHIWIKNMILIKFQKLTTKLVIAVVVLLILVAILSMIDISSDILNEVPWGHVLIELAIVFCLIFSAILITVLFNKKIELTLSDIKSKFIENNNNVEFLRKENKRLVQGLSSNINKQFIFWHLTKSEIEIGFLLLKGFSLKEISELRSTSERTVREQAGSIYHKSNMAGRSALTAFFLEDLLFPHE